MAQTIIDTQKSHKDTSTLKTSVHVSHEDASCVGSDSTHASTVQDEHAKKSSQESCACAVGDVLSGAWIKRTFPGHEHSVIGGIVGLIVACLIFTLGFMRVIVILLCVALGIAAGQIADGNPKLMRMFRNFFRDKRI